LKKISSIQTAINTFFILINRNEEWIPHIKKLRGKVYADKISSLWYATLVGIT